MIKVGRVEAAIYLQSNDFTMEIDNHVDTTVLGSNCLQMNYFERLVDISRWDTSSGSVDCPTKSGAIEHDHPISGQVYMLVYHQTTHCPILESHLMCPMQIRMAGFRINDLPKFLAQDLDEKTHVIIVDDMLNQNEPLIILLALKGIASY